MTIARSPNTRCTCCSLCAFATPYASDPFRGSVATILGGAGAVAAIGPDGELAYYLAIGMVATVNPCGFAMLPAYLSFFLGLEGQDEAAESGLEVPLPLLAGGVALALLAGLSVLAFRRRAPGES